MRFTKSTGVRFSVLIALAALASACGNTASPKPVNGTSTDIVATVPEPPAANDEALPKMAPGQSITLSKVVWDDYQAYLAKVGRIGNGYYAVTEDGNGGASWACGEAFCGAGYDGQNTAMKQCQSANAGKTCIIFAKDDRILVKYELAQ